MLFNNMQNPPESTSKDQLIVTYFISCVQYGASFFCNVSNVHTESECVTPTNNEPTSLVDFMYTLRGGRLVSSQLVSVYYITLFLTEKDY